MFLYFSKSKKINGTRIFAVMGYLFKSLSVENITLTQFLCNANIKSSSHVKLKLSSGPKCYMIVKSLFLPQSDDSGIKKLTQVCCWATERYPSESSSPRNTRLSRLVAYFSKDFQPDKELLTNSIFAHFFSYQ